MGDGRRGGAPSYGWTPWFTEGPLLHDRGRGNPCLHFRVLGDGRPGQKNCSDPLPPLLRSVLWPDHANPQGEFFHILFRG